ncbi:MAG: TonB-dependent receptor [Magnetococcus sp. YQC-5]
MDKALEAELAFLHNEQKSTVATKTELPVSMSPAPVTVIPYDQIRRSGATSIPDLLRLVPGVNVRWNPMMQTLAIRGFGQNPISNRVLLLIDGVPYNSPVTGGFLMQPGTDFFSIENVKQIEVIRGPGSALYGENAFWGVINIVTISGADLDGGKVKTLISNQKTKDVSIQYGGIHNDKSYLISAQYLKNQLPMHLWKESDSEAVGKDLFLKGGIKGWELTHYRHDDDTKGFNQTLGTGTFRSADHIKQKISITALKGEQKFTSIPITIQGDLSHSQKKSNRCEGCHDYPSNVQKANEVVDHGTQMIADVRAITKALPMQELMLGVDWRQIDAEDHVDVLTGSKMVPKYQKTAYYLQDRVMLLNNQLNLFLGVRYDGQTDPELFDAKISPRLSAVYQATPNTTLRTGWSRAYRYPSFTEMYLSSGYFNIISAAGVARVNSKFKSNPDLQPEKIETYDLGIEHHLTKDTVIKADLYYSQVDQFIVIANLPATVTGGNTWNHFENHPDTAKIHGGELEIRSRLNTLFSVFGNIAYQEQRQQGTKKDGGGRLMEFLYAPEFKLGAGVYVDATENLRASLELQWLDSQIVPENRRARRISQGTPYDVPESLFINTRMDYTPPLTTFGMGDRRPLELNFIVNNLLNQKNEETIATGSPNRGLGRELMAGFTLKF